MAQQRNNTVVEAFLASLIRRAYSQQTILSYQRILKDYIAWLETKDLDICLIKPRDIERFQIFLVLGPRGKPLSARRRALYIAVLRSFYKYCINQQQPCHEILESMDYPIQPTTIRQDILTLDEMHSLLHVAADQGGWQNLALRLMLLSGLRVGEVVALGIQDVNLKQREIVIRQAKGGKHRLVFIDKQTIRGLKEYLSKREPADALGHANLLVNSGKPLTNDQVYGAVKRMAQLAGIPRSISPHSLRRTFATRLLDTGVKGMNLKVVAELLGHASLQTTAKYAQVDEQTLARVYQSAHPALNGAITL